MKRFFKVRISTQFLFFALLVFISFFSKQSYAKNVFIDPSSSLNGDGSFVSPYNSWNQIKFISTDDYYQKCDTSWFGSFSIDVIGTDTDNIIIGAYYIDQEEAFIGVKGERPIISQNENDTSTIVINGKYILITNLNVKRGLSSINFKGSNCTVENCYIGENALFGVRVVGKSATNNIIRNNIIDSKENVYNHKSSDGIALTNFSSRTDVYNNILLNWWHNAIQFEFSSYNNITSNTLINPYKINTRFFGMTGGSNYNIISSNWVQDMDARNQIGGGSNNEICYNIFYKMSDTTNDEGSCIWFQGIGGSPCRNNKFYNNFIFGIQREGIRFYNNIGNGAVENNEVFNNVILNIAAGFPSIRIEPSDNGVLSQKIYNNIIYNSNDNDYILYRRMKLSVSDFNSSDIENDYVSENKWEDPKFVDAQNGNFAFKSDSPCPTRGISPINIRPLSISSVFTSSSLKIIGNQVTTSSSSTIDSPLNLRIVQ